MLISENLQLHVQVWTVELLPLPPMEWSPSPLQPLRVELRTDVILGILLMELEPGCVDMIKAGHL